MSLLPQHFYFIFIFLPTFSFLPLPYCVPPPPKMDEDIHQRSISHREDHLGDRKTRTTGSKRSDRLSLETYAIRTRLLKQRYKFADSSVFWLDIVIA